MKRKSLRTILLAFMFSMLPMLLEAQQEKRPQPGTKLTDEQIKQWVAPMRAGDRKSTRLNSSHLVISYAVFCLKKKKKKIKEKESSTKHNLQTKLVHTHIRPYH